MSFLDADAQRCLAEARKALGIERFVLSVHDASFPGDAEEDLGRGSPYSPRAGDFFELARALGFTGVQLGPQGITSEHNASPYDGTVFSKNPLSLALGPLVRGEDGPRLLSEQTLAALVRRRPEGALQRVPYRFVYRAQREALAEVSQRFSERAADGEQRALVDELAAFRAEHAAWLEVDVLYRALSEEHRNGIPRCWREDGRLFAPEPGEAEAARARLAGLREKYAEPLSAHALEQLLLHRQHRRLRTRVEALGLKLYGDLQIGLGPEDTWRWSAVFLRHYVMGAPPSRTTPEGQAWGYPVLSPDACFENGAPGPGLRFVLERLTKLLSEFDGVRIDHPHGWVCPWVYRVEAPDALHAVQGGARLHESPDLPEHPELARYAIARREQLDASLPRHADGWVRALEPAQVDAYARIFDTLVEAARRNGRAVEDLLCEVLSTLPYPLQRVMERHGMGRFRVTQKVDLANPRDVYRSENAQPSDWMMVGNHDTSPLWGILEGWSREQARAHADYLAERLRAPGRERELFARHLSEDRSALAQAKLAELFSSRARNVMVFFADLLGMREPYNVPGTISDANWSLRVPPDFERHYALHLAKGQAFDVPGALAWALAARPAQFVEAHRGLMERLEALSRAARNR
jgi:4-alpha-glucanotransferase